MRLGVLLVLVLALPATAVAAAARPVLHVRRTCFEATGPDGKAYAIFGRRYAVGSPQRSTPAIVFVHGVGSSADTWDITRRSSVARRLARAGYVTIAYDRLGYSRSRYTGAGGGDALTVTAQQRVLHDVVGALHGGGYGVGARCTATRLASRRVAIAGHSAGGFIVSSYPGRYHDVVAMIQSNAPSGLFSTDPPGNAALVGLAAPAPQGSFTERYGPIGDAWNDGRHLPLAGADYAYDFADRRACEDFNFWRPGAAKTAATVLCDPANAIATPRGETASFLDQAVANATLIPRTGKVPVLLAGADHDGVMPGAANALELSAWKEKCGCDVSQFVLRRTGHAFMGHRSLRRWTAHVTRWLRTHGIR